MQQLDSPLVTPVYLKTAEESPWPGEPGAFYLMGANGSSSAATSRSFAAVFRRGTARGALPARELPLALLPADPPRGVRGDRGVLRRPRRAARSKGMALILWDPGATEVRTLVPRQTTRVSTTGRLPGHERPDLCGARVPEDQGHPLRSVPRAEVVEERHEDLLERRAADRREGEREEALRAGGSFRGPVPRRNTAATWSGGSPLAPMREKAPGSPGQGDSSAVFGE